MYHEGSEQDPHSDTGSFLEKWREKRAWEWG